MKKEEVIQIIIKCANLYNKNLENKNIIFVFGNLDRIFFFESTYLAKHFLHLTGVTLNPNIYSGSSDFYKKCLRSELSVDDFSVPLDGNTAKKLTVLPQLMQIFKTAKMVGDYNFSKSRLLTEKLTGNITACMGFVRDDIYYIPNTVLKEDMRDITNKPQQRMLAIFRKRIFDQQYNELTYIAKDIYIESLSNNEKLNELIDFKNLKANFPIPHNVSDEDNIENENLTKLMISSIEDECNNSLKM